MTAIDPSKPSIFYKTMSPRWQIVSDILGGTEAMRKKSATYLPKHQNESAESYNNRVNRSVFLNIFSLTLDFLVGKPFSEAITLSEDMPEDIKNILDDIDLQGNNIDQFAKNLLKTALAKGFTHVLIETPTIDKPKLTLKEQQEFNIRPYWVHLYPESVIAVRSENFRGRTIITHLRFIGTEIKISNLEEVEVKVITMMDLEEDGFVKVTKLQESKKGVVVKNSKNSQYYKGWTVVSETKTQLTKINLVTLYAGEKSGFLTIEPVLMDLAYLNIQHYQSESDQTAILTTSRFPILAATGYQVDDTQLTVGPNNVLASSDVGAKFFYVEHTGAAIEAGREHGRDIEARMALYGAQLLKPRPDRETATSRAIDEAAVTAPLQEMALELQDRLNECLDITASLLGVDSGGTVLVHNDFALDGADAVVTQALGLAFDKKAISRKTYLDQLRRRGVLSKDYDSEKDLLQLIKETELLSKVNPQDPNSPPSDNPQDPNSPPSDNPQDPNNPKRTTK